MSHLTRPTLGDGPSGRAGPPFCPSDLPSGTVDSLIQATVCLANVPLGLSDASVSLANVSDSLSGVSDSLDPVSDSPSGVSDSSDPVSDSSSGGSDRSNRLAVRLE